MIVLKYVVLSLFVIGTCRALNFKDIKAKIQKRKSFVPNKLLKPVIVTTKPVIPRPTKPTLPLENKSDGTTNNNLNDTKVLNAEEPQVTILESNDFSTTMMVTAAVILRKGVNLFPSNPCEILRGVFLRTYSEYEWQCVDYNMLAVGSRKSINLEVKDKKYLLFATNK